jgi:dTDP-glucose 4,6-dehydratase
VTVVVTGGAGFIGSNFISRWFSRTNETLVNLDLLTYAGNVATLELLAGDTRHVFVHGDICDAGTVRGIFERYRPRAILNFAAESHVDRSIDGPAGFVRTNVQGTFTLLDEALRYWRTLDGSARDAFRFLHVSTDEVYGTLGPKDPAFTETTPFAPNSPYAASKAASDHLVRAWHHTYGLPVLTTNCSNNYGPYQFPEKLIPLMITHALAGKPLPIYGDGGNVRDWLYVEDHCDAILTVLDRGRVGETYNVGGNSERTNLQVVRLICELLDEMKPSSAGSYSRLMTFVTDRPGHDRRYAIDCSKLGRELGWQPTRSFESGMSRTVAWYLENAEWVRRVTSGAFREWIERNYGARGTVGTR